MKRNLIAPILAGILTIGGLSSCVEKLTVEGNVIKEKYTPATGGGFFADSSQWDAEIKLSSGKIIYIRKFKDSANSADFRYDVGDKVKLVKKGKDYYLDREIVARDF